MLELLYLDHFLETSLIYPAAKHSASAQACLASSVGCKQVSKEEENDDTYLLLLGTLKHKLKFRKIAGKQSTDYFSNHSRPMGK